MSGWFFWKRKPAQPSKPIDGRNWNEDWKIGDIAECVSSAWHETVKPWERPNLGDKLIVTGFKEGVGTGVNRIAYFLLFAEYDHGLETLGFRKVLPISTVAESEIGQKILRAKPAPDRKVQA